MSQVLVKYLADQLTVQSPTCGELREILRNGEFKPLGIAIAMDIKPTEAHYHLTFTEIYFVLDGEISLALYYPETKEIKTYHLKASELAVITEGIHHKIIKATDKNRLCVISVPPFHADDEHPSDKL